MNWARCSVPVWTGVGFGQQYGCDVMETLAESTEKYYVKCCSDKVVNDHFLTQYESLKYFQSPYFKETGVVLDVCPYHLVDEEQCPGKLNHEKAVEYCHEKGGRLCTSEELWNGCARGGPDSCASELVWTPPYSYEYSVDSGCLTSQMDSAVSSKAMQNCDESMALLVGSSLSVGSLSNLAKAISEEGSAKMPGLCCLDQATDSEFLGHNVRVSMMFLTCFLFSPTLRSADCSLFYHFCCLDIKSSILQIRIHP